MNDSPEASEESASDEMLMHSVAKGDSQAFRRLVERHQGLVIGTVTRMLGPAEAEDLSQRVFLNVWKSAPRWRPEARFTTWLLTITKRLVFNESRRRVRSRLVPKPDGQDTHQEEIPDETPGPDRQLLNLELRRAIDMTLETLPERERMAVVLRRYEQLTYEEIGAVLGLSVPAVKSLLFRARATLRDKLAPYLEGRF
jgi:RNA polymerase sigma-70 factor, ECF subfamily